MLEIICKRNFDISLAEINKMEYRELLKEECYFCIKIDNLVFFEDPLFPCHEFLYHYSKWDKKSNFIYITLESLENPLLSFIKTSKGWTIDSVWKNFACVSKFSLFELCNAIEESCL